MYFIYDNDPEIGHTNFIPCVTPEDGDFLLSLGPLLSEISYDYDVLDGDGYNQRIIDVMRGQRQQYTLSTFWGPWFDKATDDELLSFSFELSCFYQGNKGDLIPKGEMMVNQTTNAVLMYVSDAADGTINMLQLTHMGLQNRWQALTMNPFDLMAMKSITLPVDAEQVLLFHEPLFQDITLPECDIF